MEPTRRLFLFLFLFLAVAFPGMGASPPSVSLPPPSAWLVASAPPSGLETRGAGTYGFVPVSEGRNLSDEFLLRFRPDAVASTALPAAIFHPGRGTTLDVHRGAVIRLDRSGLRILLGRVRAAVASSGALLPVRLTRGNLEIQAGEALVEVNAEGDACVALRKGVAWIKADDRTIIRLVEGKQVELPRWGAPGKLRDLDSRWKDYSTGFMSSPERKDQPTKDSDEDQSEEGVIEASPDSGAEEGNEEGTEVAAETSSGENPEDAGPADPEVGSDPAALPVTGSYPAVLDIDEPPLASGSPLQPVVAPVAPPSVATNPAGLASPTP